MFFVVVEKLNGILSTPTIGPISGISRTLKKKIQKFFFLVLLQQRVNFGILKKKSQLILLDEMNKKKIKLFSVFYFRIDRKIKGCFELLFETTFFLLDINFIALVFCLKSRIFCFEIN